MRLILVLLGLLRARPVWPWRSPSARPPQRRSVRPGLRRIPARAPARSVGASARRGLSAPRWWARARPGRRGDAGPVAQSAGRPGGARRLGGSGSARRSSSRRPRRRSGRDRGRRACRRAGRRRPGGGPGRPLREPETLILFGVALSALGGAATALIFNLSPSPITTAEVLTWLLGSVANRDWTDIAWRCVPMARRGGLCA